MGKEELNLSDLGLLLLSVEPWMAIKWSVALFYLLLDANLVVVLLNYEIGGPNLFSASLYFCLLPSIGGLWKRIKRVNNWAVLSSKVFQQLLKNACIFFVWGFPFLQSFFLSEERHLFLSVGALTLRSCFWFLYRSLPSPMGLSCLPLHPLPLPSVKKGYWMQFFLHCFVMCLSL